VSPARWYLAGVALVAAGGAGLTLLVPALVRTEVGWGVVTGLVLQAPLGWWTLRSVGTPKFLMVWGFGMLARLVLLALAGVVALPYFGRSSGPMLGAMVGVLVALLLVEGVTAVLGFAREDGA
jgi:hypothetical protein